MSFSTANYGSIGSIIGQLLVRSAYFSIGEYNDKIFKSFFYLIHFIKLIESYFDDYDNLTLKTEIRQAFEEGSECLVKGNHTFIDLNIINKTPEYIKVCIFLSKW